MILNFLHQCCQHLEPVGSLLKLLVVERLNLVLWEGIKRSERIERQENQKLTESSLMIAPVLQPCSSVTSKSAIYINIDSANQVLSTYQQDPNKDDLRSRALDVRAIPLGSVEFSPFPRSKLHPFPAS